MENKEMISLTPFEIVATLDKYIIGQKDAKKNVAIALRNRWRRVNAKENIQQEIAQNNILMIGATGVGKTEIARRLAKITNAPFIKVEASKFTEVGYVGRDVESMVRDLMENAVNLVKIDQQEKVREKGRKIVEDILLDILIPPVTSATAVSTNDNTQQLSPEDNKEMNYKTREKFRSMIQEGTLDKRKIEIEVRTKRKGAFGAIGGGIDESSIINLQEMIGEMMPKKKGKRKVTVKEAKKILLEEEVQKMIDMEQVKEKALHLTENLGIIFIDEIDKIAKSGTQTGADVSREGVQRDLLPIVEGSTVNTKYGSIKTDHILFIGAGAFHVAKPSDLIPELQGRFPIRVELESLSNEDFQRILKEPKNALTKQYQGLFDAENVNISFDDEALNEVASVAFQINAEIENIGARRLQTVMSYLLNDFLFDVPDKIVANTRIVINKQMVVDKLSPLVKNKDFSQYII